MKNEIEKGNKQKKKIKEIDTSINNNITNNIETEIEMEITRKYKLERNISFQLSIRRMKFPSSSNKVPTLLSLTMSDPGTMYKLRLMEILGNEQTHEDLVTNS